MVVVDGQGIPLGSQLTSATPNEVRFAQPTLAAINSHKRPARVIADRGYDSNPLRLRLQQQGMLLIAPHRRNRSRGLMNDGRWLRRYRKRWKIERTFAWLGNYRRLLVRYDQHLSMYCAFFHIACALITLRFLLN
jgi:transposase